MARLGPTGLTQVFTDIKNWVNSKLSTKADTAHTHTTYAVKHAYTTAANAAKNWYRIANANTKQVYTGNPIHAEFILTAYNSSYDPGYSERWYVRAMVLGRNAHVIIFGGNTAPFNQCRVLYENTLADIDDNDRPAIDIYLNYVLANGTTKIEIEEVYNQGWTFVANGQLAVSTVPTGFENTAVGVRGNGVERSTYSDIATYLNKPRRDITSDVTLADNNTYRSTTLNCTGTRTITLPSINSNYFWCVIKNFNAEAGIITIHPSTTSVLIDGSNDDIILRPGEFVTIHSRANDSFTIVGDNRKRTCLVGRSGVVGTDTKHWFRVAQKTLKTGYRDAFILFDVFQVASDSNYMGRLCAHVRVDGTVGVVGNKQFSWLYRGTQLSDDDFAMTTIETSGTSVVVDIWCKRSGSYSAFAFAIVSEGFSTDSLDSPYGKWILTRERATVGDLESLDTGFTTVTNPSVVTLANSITGNAGSATVAQQVRKDPVAGSTADLLYSQCAGTDIFRLQVGGASNAGYVEIATADDGSEPIYVRQYKGNFTSLQRTATLLDGSGNTSFPGQVTGVKFDGPLTWSGTAFSYNAGNSLYYYSGQPAIANCFEGSSNDFTKFSYPAGGTAVSSINANIQTLRLDWGNTYWHDLFMSPNNNYLWHRNVVNSDARGWRRIVEENVTGLTDQSWNINIAGTAANVTGTVTIAHGGTGATTRLDAVKNLTNESVGTPTHFLAITTNWGKAGYTTVAQAKTVLGITGDIGSHSDSEYVHKTGNETISGIKTISTHLRFSSANTRGTAPSANEERDLIDYKDSAGNRISLFETMYYTDKSSKTSIYAYKTTAATGGNIGSIGIGCDASGNVYTYAPTPASLDNSTKIATTAFVYNTAAKHLSAATNIYVAKVATGNGSGSNTSNYMSLADLRTYLATVHMHSSTSDMNGSYNLQILFKAGDSFGNATFDATKMPGVRNLILNTSAGTNSTVDNYSTNSPTFGNITVTGDISVTMRNLNCTGRISSQHGAYVNIDTYMGISSLQATNYGYLNVTKNMVINVCDAHADYFCLAMNNGILSMWPGATVTINFRQQCYYTRSLFYAASNGTAWIGYSSFKLTGTEPMAVWGGSGTLTGTSETAAATVEKAVTLASGQTFTLATNATAKVKFTVDNTAANPTLNIGGTGAKPIYWNNAPVQATMLMKNITYDVKYNGSQFVIQNAVKRLTNNDFGVFRSSGNYNQTYNSGSWNFTGWALYYGTGIENSNWRGNHIGNIQQNVSTSNNTYPVLISGTANATANTSTAPYFAKGVKINPSTNVVSASGFSGNLTGNVTGNCSGSSGSCTGNAATATQFSANTTVALTGDATGTSAGSKKGWSVPVTLANSGVTAGDYGPSADASPAHSGTFTVPSITVDAKGRITAASTKTITLPADNNTDTKVTQTVTTGNSSYPVLLCATANATATGTTTSRFSEGLTVNTRYSSITMTNKYDTANTKGVRNTSSYSNGILYFRCYDASEMGTIRCESSKNGYQQTYIQARSYIKNGAISPEGTSTTCYITVRVRDNGSKTIYTDGSWENSLTPYADNTHSLGTSSLKWKNVYANDYYKGTTAFGDIVTHNASEFLTSQLQSIATRTSSGTWTISNVPKGSILYIRGTVTMTSIPTGSSSYSISLESGATLMGYPINTSGSVPPNTTVSRTDNIGMILFVDGSAASNGTTNVKIQLNGSGSTAYDLAAYQ